MTLVGYFNSLRELGGVRRLVEDDVRLRCESFEEVKPEDAIGDHPWVVNRKIDAMPLELTSRESTANITDYKTRLSLDRTDKKGVDVVLASNMISVGVDIERLGLMVIAGQPKTTAEYIQASSRVGRDKNRPGLVLTCYNLRKPRDRSHYEHFITYHESFYRYVEAMSLTPFSGPALDRGLAGVLMALARLSNAEMTVPSAAMLIEDPKYRAMADQAAEIIAQRAGQVLEPNSMQGQSSTEDVVTAIRDRALSLLDTWTELVIQAREGSGSRRYSPWERGEGKELLRLALDALKHNSSLSDEERRFVAPTSMRDVEPVVHVWVDRVPSQEKEKPDGH
mgnify:CR=1 FL=1